MTVHYTVKEDAPPLEKAAFPIAEFCARNSISLSTYHRIKDQGFGPDTMRIGGTVRISREQELAWQRRMANPDGPAAKKRLQAEERAVANAKKAGRLAAQSPRHVSKRKRKA